LDIFLKNEGTLAQHVDWWVRVWILKERPPYEFAFHVLKWDRKELCDVFKPINRAMNWEPKPGALLGRPHNTVRRSVDSSLKTREEGRRVKLIALEEK